MSIKKYQCFREKLVGARGFEPPTPRSRTECSTRLSHAPTAVHCTRFRFQVPGSWFRVRVPGSSSKRRFSVLVHEPGTRTRNQNLEPEGGTWNRSDSIIHPAYSRFLRTMRAAVERAVCLDAVADDLAMAVRARGREQMDRTLE